MIGEIARPLDADGGERAQPHQHLAVAGDDRDAPLRLRQRQPEPDHGGAAHGAPEIEIAVVVAGGGEIPGGRAEAGHDQQIVAPVGEQRGHGGAAIELSFGPHLLADQLLRQQHGDDALVAEGMLHGALGRAFDLVGVRARDRLPLRTA